MKGCWNHQYRLVFAILLLAVGHFASSSSDPIQEEVPIIHDAAADDGSSDASPSATLTHNNNDDACSLYLAKSLVGTGWGVFAGRDLFVNDDDNVFQHDPSILVPDMGWMHLVPDLHLFQALTKPPQIHMGLYEADHVSVMYVERRVFFVDSKIY